ncbi:MAG: PglZ domain-containing protein [Isosphaerales bacterium]
MAIVTDYLLQLIAKQVDDRGLVVWYDPEQAYDAAAAELHLANTTVARYNGSFFKLRKEIDHLLNDGQPPRLVIYVPIERTETHSALIELDCAGVIMQPRQQPPACNTRLSVVARNALKPILAEDQVAEIERQVEAGKLSLADLNSLADKGKGISTGVLTLIFGSANPQEVALAFLHSDQHDDEIGKKTSEKELRHLLQVGFDIELPAAEAPSNWRVRLGRHVLLTDLFAALKKQVPSSLSSVPVATSAGGIDACVRLARTWRNSRDVRDSYVTVANKVERELALGQLELPVEPLRENETFLCIERALLVHVESELLKAATPALLRLAEYRLSRFWADVIPAVQARWALIASAAEVLLEADRVGKAIKEAPSTVPALVKAYADDDEPWCLLDTHHRHMETRWCNFEPESRDDPGRLDQLVLKAERRYTEVGSALAELFVSQFSKAKHPITGLPRQRDIFETHVKPRLRESKVAYVWVDALRFEMARELAQVLSNDFVLTIEAALGTVPTITEIGMAALLPRAGQSAKVVSVGSGKLGLQIDRTVIKNRKDRVAFLESHAGIPVFACKLDDLLPKPNKKIKDGVHGAQLVLVTSQEIDELCEADNITQARRQMDGVLNDLRCGFRVLVDLGVKTIVLAADHGHLFGEEVGDDMKIEAPGGDTADLHRRVWVGVGGTSEPSYLRMSLKALGVDSDLDLATPWTLACFKSKGGARAYFHGGLSPQELIIPVVVMTPTAQALSGPPTGIQWTLTTGSKKLSTRFFSVQVSGQSSGLFNLEAPRVRVEIRAKGKCVSVPVSASYGFEQATGDLQLRFLATDARQIEPDTVTLMVEVDQIGQKTVSVSLLDATSGAELANMDKVEVTNII